MNRAQHLKWCKDRALIYCNAGRLQEALSSILSDRQKHPETANHPGITLCSGRMAFGDLTTVNQVREFIEGFN
jgi:hypothetical protein